MRLADTENSILKWKKQLNANNFWDWWKVGRFHRHFFAPSGLLFKPEILSAIDKNPLILRGPTLIDCVFYFTSL